ncbi:MAG: choice-of-anchor B family protein [Saprospiraceae bacterium]
MIFLKKIYFALLLTILTHSVTVAQLNMSLVGDLGYGVDLSDIWGYTDANGNEYAIVGLANGVSVVDLSNPATPVEVGYAPGFLSIWRDVKVWGDYAYVTCDQGSDGLMVIDLSNLPNGISHSFYRPELTVASGTDTLEKAHNIWIDENGYAYISGSNVGNRGVLFLDVHTTPGTPIFVGAEDVTYSHDCYTRGDTLYTADVYSGFFSVYDVSNKANPVFLGSRTTPSLFTHNVWLSDNSKYLFTTDEKPDAFVGSYDVTDPNNIIELDRFKPDSTLGQGVIPHNVHVWDDYLIVSYYTDGCIIVDAARPHNLIEVGNFDTYFPSNSGFNGAWGAYPYFPSGLVAVSDIDDGLFILQPNYVRACYLEGKVTDAITGANLNNVSVKITNTLSDESTDANGDYATGFATAGTYNVTYSLFGYAQKTETVTLSNGILTIKDVQLQPLQAFSLTGNVTETGLGTAIEDAVISIYNDDYSFDATTNATGDFNINDFYNGDYTIVIGKWGYKSIIISSQNIPVNSSVLNFTLEKGYEDDFSLDLGWAVTGTATTGDWEIAVPVGINDAQYGAITPSEDISTDFGNRAYVTENGGASAGSNDVDNGTVTLTSPSFDLTNYNDPYLSYYTWFVNQGNQSTPNDELVVKLFDGNQTIVIETITQSNGAWNPKKLVRISDFVTPTNDMQIIFETSDLPSSGHFVEAGVDAFMVFDSINVNTNNIPEQLAALTISPNPSSSQFNIDYETINPFNQGQIEVYNAVGQLIETVSIELTKGQINLGSKLESGFYIIQFVLDGKISAQEKVVKY